MSKHNKKRNVGLLYEVLVQELTKAVVESNAPRRQEVLGIIKSTFHQKSEMKKELELYNALSDLDGLSRDEITRLFEMVKKQYSHLDQKRLRYEKDKAISKLNKRLGPAVFGNFVPNYRNLATISQIFNGKTPAKRQIMLESQLIDNLLEKKEKEMQPIDNLTYLTFVKKFNEKYKDTLLQEQRTLLNRYMMSSEDEVSFTVYVSETIGDLKETISKMVETPTIIMEGNTSEDINESLKGVLEKLQDYSKSDIDSEVIESIMKTQQLMREIGEQNGN